MGNYADRGTRTYAGRMIPSGTQLAVRTNEDIRSTEATPGRSVSAVVDRHVLDESGQVVIPRASAARLLVRDMSTGGAVGSRQLMLDLQSVTVDGNTYYVSTEDLRQAGDREGLGRNRRTDEM